MLKQSPAEPFLKIQAHLNNNHGYDKIKVANGIQQRSYISFFWSGVCVFWQFCKVVKPPNNSIERSAKICEPLDIEVKKPIICGRQIMRDNVEAESGRLL
jgi:hypothetical protein